MKKYSTQMINFTIQMKLCDSYGNYTAWMKKYMIQMKIMNTTKKFTIQIKNSQYKQTI